jgi:hypothetical protein
VTKRCVQRTGRGRYLVRLVNRRLYTDCRLVNRRLYSDCRLVNRRLYSDCRLVNRRLYTDCRLTGLCSVDCYNCYWSPGFESWLKGCDVRGLLWFSPVHPRNSCDYTCSLLTYPSLFVIHSHLQIVTAWGTLVLGKLTVAYLMEEFAVFMEPQGSLPCLQEPQLVLILSQFSPTHILALHFFRIHFNVIFSSTFVLLNGCLLLDFPTWISLLCYTNCEAPRCVVFYSLRHHALKHRKSVIFIYNETHLTVYEAEKNMNKFPLNCLGVRSNGEIYWWEENS